MPPEDLGTRMACVLALVYLRAAFSPLPRDLCRKRDPPAGCARPPGERGRVGSSRRGWAPHWPSRDLRWTRRGPCERYRAPPRPGAPSRPHCARGGSVAGDTDSGLALALRTGPPRLRAPSRGSSSRWPTPGGAPASSSVRPGSPAVPVLLPAAAAVAAEPIAGLVVGTAGQPGLAGTRAAHGSAPGPAMLPWREQLAGVAGRGGGGGRGSSLERHIVRRPNVASYNTQCSLGEAGRAARSPGGCPTPLFILMLLFLESETDLAAAAQWAGWCLGQEATARCRSCHVNVLARRCPLP